MAFDVDRGTVPAIIGIVGVGAAQRQMENSRVRTWTLLIDLTCLASSYGGLSACFLFSPPTTPVDILSFIGSVRRMVGGWPRSLLERYCFLGTG